MTADTPAASKDAPTDEVVKAAMARVLDPGEDMPVNDPWPFNVLLDAYVGLRADGLALAAHVAALTSKLKSLQARLEDVSAQLEAERATGDETARHISRLLDHLARETARADAAEAEAKALREALEKIAFGPIVACPFDSEKCTVKPDEPCPVCGDVNDFDAPTNCGTGNARSIARATLAQPADDGGAT